MNNSNPDVAAARLSNPDMHRLPGVWASLQLHQSCDTRDSKDLLPKRPWRKLTRQRCCCDLVPQVELDQVLEGEIGGRSTSSGLPGIWQLCSAVGFRKHSRDYLLGLTTSKKFGMVVFFSCGSLEASSARQAAAPAAAECLASHKCLSRAVVMKGLKNMSALWKCSFDIEETRRLSGSEATFWWLKVKHSRPSDLKTTRCGRGNHVGTTDTLSLI